MPGSASSICTRRSAGRGWSSRKSTPNCRGPMATRRSSRRRSTCWCRPPPPPIELPTRPAGRIDRAIADHVARLIPDRATIELGLGAIPQAVTRALGRKQGLGIHSGGDRRWDRRSDGGRHRRQPAQGDRPPAVTVATMLMGTSRLYRFADRNPAIQIRATSYTHDALVLGNFRRFIAINGAPRGRPHRSGQRRDRTGNAYRPCRRPKWILYVPPTAPRRGVRSSRLQSDQSRTQSFRASLPSWPTGSSRRRAPRPTSWSPSMASRNCAPRHLG